MPLSFAARPVATRGNSLDVGRPAPAKAELPTARRLPALAAEAMRRTFGKQEAAALTLARDPGAFSRKLRSGRLTLGELEAQGEIFLAHFGELLVEDFGHARRDPRDEAIDAIPGLVEQFLRAVRR